jgi:hypothetical protein
MKTLAVHYNYQATGIQFVAAWLQASQFFFPNAVRVVVKDFAFVEV